MEVIEPFMKLLPIVVFNTDILEWETDDAKAKIYASRLVDLLENSSIRMGTRIDLKLCNKLHYFLDTEQIRRLLSYVNITVISYADIYKYINIDEEFDSLIGSIQPRLSLRF